MSNVPQRDYILRMIEQAAAVVKAVLDQVLRRAAGPGEVERQLRTAMHYAGFDLDLARVANPVSLEEMVAPDGRLEPGRGWLIAECLYVDGLDAQLEDDPVRARQSFEKALRLYRLFDPTAAIPTGFPRAAERIGELERRLLELGDRRH